MRKIEKVLNLIFLSLIISIVFFSTASVYSIEPSKRTHLRIPFLTSSKEAEEAKEKELKRIFREYKDAYSKDGDGLLICDDPEIIEKVKQQIKKIASELFLEVEASDVASWDDRKAKDIILNNHLIVMNVDLDDEEQAWKFALMRSNAHSRDQENRKYHYSFIKPGTTHSIPLDHPSYNWGLVVRVKLPNDTVPSQVKRESGRESI